MGIGTRLLPSSRPDNVRRRLWLGAFGVALFVVCCVAGLLWVNPGYEACRRAFGRDFLAFYAAGTLARDGRASELYDLRSIQQLERETAKSAGIDLGDAVGPWWNPPVFAWVFVPFTALPFGQALLAWTSLNVVAAGVGVYLLGRTLRSDRVSDCALVALLVLASAPFLQSIAHGQNSGISLLLVSIAITAWRSGNSFLASACLGLLLYKPQLAAALAVVLVLSRGFRAGAGLAYVGVVLFALGQQTMPGALADYLHRVPLNLHKIQIEQTYLWDRHVTLLAFWRLLLQGRGPGEASWLVYALTIVSAVPLLLALPFAALRSRKNPRARDAVIAATLVSAPLLMPFYFDYDLLLLAAAAVLAKRSVMLWAGLYAWLFVNPYVAAAIRVNLTVPLLWAVAASLLMSALRREEGELRFVRETDVPPAPLTQAA